MHRTRPDPAYFLTPPIFQPVRVDPIGGAQHPRQDGEDDQRLDHRKPAFRPAPVRVGRIPPFVPAANHPHRRARSASRPTPGCSGRAPPWRCPHRGCIANVLWVIGAFLKPARCCTQGQVLFCASTFGLRHPRRASFQCTKQDLTPQTTLNEIANTVGLHYSSISKIIKAWRDRDNAKIKT